MKILLIEDDELLRASFAKILIEHRYLVDLASDGQVGLELATTVDYDLIFQMYKFRNWMALVFVGN